MRKEEFPPDGRRVVVSPERLVRAWLACDLGSLVPLRYVVGTADHESSFTSNEVDTEASGYVSRGIFQVSDQEAAHAGYAGADLLDLTASCLVFRILSTERLAALRLVAKLAAGSAAPDLLAYMSVAHNQGIGAALRTVRLHGMDWAVYKARNTAFAEAELADARKGGDRATVRAKEDRLKWWRKVAAYGDDCASGGPRWREVVSAGLVLPETSTAVTAEPALPAGR